MKLKKMRNKKLKNSGKLKNDFYQIFFYINNNKSLFAIFINK